jgi:hypothetical protein
VSSKDSSDVHPEATRFVLSSAIPKWCHLLWKLTIKGEKLDTKIEWGEKLDRTKIVQDGSIEE